MDAALDENQTKLRVLVLTVAFQVFTDGHGLLDQVVQIFWLARRKAFGFHQSQDFAAGDESSLSDTVRITKNDTCEITMTSCLTNEHDAAPTDL